MKPSIYDFEVKQADQSTLSLKQYQNKVILIVNTATHCGLSPQLSDLQNLYEKYRGDGLEVLAFPSNQFNQTPENDEEIQEFCSLKYKTTFPTFAKIDVNGDDEAPLFAFLKSKRPGVGKHIKWNFTKFLVDSQGNVVRRFGPATKIETIEPIVAAMIRRHAQ